MPKVSIIIPIYNAEKAVRRCIDSVLDQEYKDFELLLMDDGSKDGSPVILDEYAEKDERVRVVHKPNSGVSATRNMALDMAKGDWIQFLDADDWITKDATKLFVRTAEENDADMVIADFYRVVGEHTSRKGDIWTSRVITREEYGDYMMKNPADYYYGVLWNKLFRREILNKYGIRMDESLHWCEDFIFNMEYVLHTENIAVLPVPIYYYVKTEGSLVQQGMNVQGIVDMKLNVVDYYKDFYRKLYDEEEYRRRKPEIMRFLVAYAGDDGANPILPSTKKLGQESVPVEVRGDLMINVFTDYYYTGKVLDRYLDAAAMRCGLELPDVKLIQYLIYSGSKKTMKEARDFTGLSHAALLISLQKLALKKLIKYTLNTDELTLNADLTADADEIIIRIRECEEDYLRLRFGVITKEEKKSFREAEETEVSAIRKQLELN
ncbi:MAG: glycosyltransferase family 2 protein [Stomatobaculum sp.]|nr:glycosyltransferase family 2 protein [Stomatobaculum sp.]